MTDNTAGRPKLTTGPTLSDQAYKALREDITTGALKPGQRLTERSLAELYTMVGLQKQGKTLFYRDFLHHLKHSTDNFIIAPGIKGLVMSVFTLPSYPYVFKVIREKIAVSS